jgi:hypothetical protein
MVMIANLQYGWTLFVNPIDQKYHWGTTAIQVAFSVFIATETWLVPIEGWFVDRFGPRIVVAFGGVLVAIAWTLNSFAGSLAQLYVAAALSGVGAGAVYGTCVGNALKWFPDRRGLAAGLTAAGFGAGTAATVIPIRDMILGYGYESAFLWFGLGQGLIIVLLSQLLRAPQAGEAPKPAARLTHSLRDYTPLEMLRSPIFWVLYVMFVLVSASGLMATAQIAPIAKDFGLAEQPMTIFFVTALGSRRVGAHAVYVRADGRAHLLHLGRNLQPVPLDLHRRFRCEIRDHECRHPLHRERHCSLGRAAGESCQELQRQLALGLRDRLDHERRGRRARALCAQANAAADYSVKLSQPIEDYRADSPGLSAGAACGSKPRKRKTLFERRMNWNNVCQEWFRLLL